MGRGRGVEESGLGRFSRGGLAGGQGERGLFQAAGAARPGRAGTEAVAGAGTDEGGKRGGGNVRLGGGEADSASSEAKRPPGWPARGATRAAASGSAAREPARPQRTARHPPG